MRCSIATLQHCIPLSPNPPPLCPTPSSFPLPPPSSSPLSLLKFSPHSCSDKTKIGYSLSSPCSCLPFPFRLFIVLLVVLSCSGLFLLAVVPVGSPVRSVLLVLFGSVRLDSSNTNTISPPQPNPRWHASTRRRGWDWNIGSQARRIAGFKVWYQL